MSKDNKNLRGFFISFDIAYQQDGLTLTERTIYSLILSLSLKDGYCFASSQYLADRVRVNRRSAERTIKNLIEVEIISLSWHHGERRIYPKRIKELQKKANLGNMKIA